MRRTLALLLALGPSGCREEAATPSLAEDARRPSAALAPDRSARPAPTRAPASYVGLVVPRLTVDVKAAVEGRIAELPVGLGDHVEAGDPVALLDNDELRHAVRQAEASARSARARLSQAQHTRDFSRDRAQQSEALRDFVSADERTQRGHELRQATAAVSTAQSDFGGHRLEIERLRAQADGLTLRAPFAAEVAAIYRDPGQSVPSEEPIVRLVSSERLVRFAVDAQDIDAFPLGTAVELARDTEPAIALARVVALAPEVDAAGMVLVEASIADEAPGEALRAGTRIFVLPNSTR